MIDISDLGIKELLFLFLNIKGKSNNEILKQGYNIPDYFVADTSIKNVKKTVKFKVNNFTKEDQLDFVNSLNNYYHFGNVKFEPQSNSKVIIQFLNTKNMSISQLLSRLYEQIKQKQLSLSSEEFSKNFFIAAFAFRGSFDLTRNYFTTDLHPSRVSCKSDVEHLIKLLILTNLNGQLNLNFRELQTEGTARATQFRINLRYVYDNFLDELKKINPYRYQQFILNESELLRKNIKNDKEGIDGFLSRIKFYLTNIVGDKKLDNIDIERLRQRLKFSSKEKNNKKKRSNEAKNFAILTKPSHCAGCHNEYETKDRTFKLRSTDDWYFEMHHVISFANDNIQTEDPDNYVKLCPACHRALTPNRADEDYQKSIISNILEDENVLEFVKNVKEFSNSTQDPIDFVYKLLK